MDCKNSNPILSKYKTKGFLKEEYLKFLSFIFDYCSFGLFCGHRLFPVPSFLTSNLHLPEDKFLLTKAWHEPPEKLVCQVSSSVLSIINSVLWLWFSISFENLLDENTRESTSFSSPYNTTSQHTYLYHSWKLPELVPGWLKLLLQLFLLLLRTI